MCIKVQPTPCMTLRRFAQASDLREELASLAELPARKMGGPVMNIPPDREALRQQAIGIMNAKAGWMIGIGLIMVVLSAAAALLPHLATLAIEAVIAYVLLIGVAATLLKGFGGSTQNSRMAEIPMGVLHLIIGVLLLLNPFEGVLALTLILTT